MTSGVAIPASDVFAENGVLMVTPTATAPGLTNRGLSNVFRTCGRDDQQGLVAADYIVKNFKGKNVAILNDKTTYGKGLADETKKALNKAGIQTFADLLRWERTDLIARFGSMGDRLWHLARGQDNRRVSAHEPMKSISNETTFNEDTSDPDLLDGHLWRMAEKAAGRAKARGAAILGIFHDVEARERVCDREVDVSVFTPAAA